MMIEVVLGEGKQRVVLPCRENRSLLDGYAMNPDERN